MKVQLDGREYWIEFSYALLKTFGRPSMVLVKLWNR